MRHHLRGDADAGVADLDDGQVVLYVQMNPHLAAGRSELDRIADQVVHDAPDVIGIGVDGGVWVVFVDFRHQHDAGAGGQHLKIQQAGAEQFRQRDGLTGHLGGVDVHDGHDVVDQHGEGVGVTQNDVDGVELVGVERAELIGRPSIPRSRGSWSAACAVRARCSA